VTRERAAVFALMAVAAARVAIYAALLPAATRPDEAQHYDRALAVARGDFGLAPQPMTTEGSGASFWGFRERHPEMVSKSASTTPTRAASAISIKHEPNHEWCEPPLYYWLLGMWHRAGKEIIPKPPLLPYWDRVLHCLLVAATVWIAYRASTRLLPQHALLAPIFIAILPQSDFYGLNNDALMPVVFGLFLLAYVGFDRDRSALGALLCGVLLSLCAWTKTISVPLIAVGLVAITFGVAKSAKRLTAAAAFAVGLLTVVPLLLLNLRTFGRLTGAFAKMQMEGQSIRPVADWFHHPVFTPKGFVAFFSELTNFYWLGEQPLNQWHGQSLFNAPWLLVWFCPFLTIAVLAFAPAKGPAWRLCIASFVGSLAFLAVTSAATDFGIRSTPSAWWTFPGFVGGRLMIGTLIPFALLVAGATARIKPSWLRVGAFVVVAVALNAMSAWNLADCFSGRYFNFFLEM
jgi:hypothetical protein